jgi:RNA polymerase sigma factor (sigma-70 family)
VSAVATLASSDRRFCWGLAYRMTGSPYDADDIAQEVWLRLSQSPPSDLRRSLRPWLARVTVNLARDALRARKRSYVGPWLPPLVEEDLLAERDFDPGAEERLLLHDRALYAYLVALSALTARERAVTILQDVCDYSVREVAAALAVTEANVKVLHHRAKRKLAQVGPLPRPVKRDAPEFERVERFIAALSSADVALVEALLADDIVVLSDGGGEHFAARVPVVGVGKVAKMYVNITKRGLAAASTFGLELRVLHGAPAVVMTVNGVGKGRSTLPHISALLFQLNDVGKIRRIYSVSASGKLRGLRGGSSHPAQ